MKISRLLVAHIVLWIGLCCLSVSATACDDVQWQLEVWEECPYAFEEPYLQYLQYGHYSEEDIAKVQADVEYYRNVWLCGTLVFPAEMIRDIGWLQLEKATSEHEGIIFSNTANEGDLVVEDDTAYWRVNTNFFVDERILSPSEAVRMLMNEGGPSLVITCRDRTVDDAPLIAVSPNFAGIKQRNVPCDGLYPVQVKSIWQIPQDGSTDESKRWLGFASCKGSWWEVQFELMLPDEWKAMVKSVHMHSDQLDVFDVNREFLRLYGDAEYWCTVDDGVFSASVMCHDSAATSQQIYQRLVEDQIKVWFSFEPMDVFCPWHACSSPVS